VTTYYHKLQYATFDTFNIFHYLVIMNEREDVYKCNRKMRDSTHLR